jgi:2-keto-3-deoxy-L-fuconate dehydrogenase
MGRLEGRRAFLTAAGQGIGRATAQAFAREGAEVIATDVDRGKLDGLESAGVARLEALDVLDTDAVNRLAASVGRIDVLFNCAGYVHHGTVLECSEKDWDFSFDLNVKSMHRTIRAFLPGMLERTAQRGRSSAIVNVASGASSIRGIPNRYAYGATKAAVIGLTKAVAADFIKRGIRCNAIAPGTVLSPSLEGRVATLAAETEESEEKVWDAFIQRQPMGRLGTAEEMAAVAVYLASDESAFTTGIVISSDGGFSL